MGANRVMPFSVVRLTAPSVVIAQNDGGARSVGMAAARGSDPLSSVADRLPA